MSFRPRRLRQLLRHSQGLEKIFREVRLQHQVLADVQALLAPAIAAHCVAAQITRQNLVLHTDSPAWATRLRFLTPQLLSQLRGRYPGLASIRLHLLPQNAAKPTPKRPPRHSAHGGELIRAGAATVADPDLRDALERLAEAVNGHRSGH